MSTCDLSFDHGKSSLQNAACALIHVRQHLYILLFFFQAEDGIRDLTVTGVQTCALPISPATAPSSRKPSRSILCKPCNLPSGGSWSRRGPSVVGGVMTVQFRCRWLRPKPLETTGLRRRDGRWTASFCSRFPVLEMKAYWLEANRGQLRMCMKRCKI